MTRQYRTLIQYPEFVQRVRRHRPSELLPMLAATAIQFKDQSVWRQDRVRLPWAIACAAKVSILEGNEHRPSGVTDDDIVQICAAYNALQDPLSLGAGDLSGSLGAFMTRVAHEQFEPQQSQFEEISRLGALLDSVDDLGLDTLTSSFIESVLGCSINEYVGASFVITVGAERSIGYFDPNWPSLSTGQNAVTAQVPAALLRQVFDQHYLTDFDGLRTIAQQVPHGPVSLRQHEYNPLRSRPFVTLPDGRHIAPQPGLAYQKMTPSAFYYTALSTLGNADRKAFTDDLGDVFEQYVGRQLQLMPQARIEPEVVYDQPEKKSVDWFVIFDDVVLLIEAKTTRLSLLARMGTGQLEEDVDRSIGKAFRQLATTETLLSKGHPAFSHIPQDRPRIGIVVTLEPYWFGNTSFVRALLPAPALPTAVTSIREVERLVDVVRVDGGPEALLRVVNDPDLREWNLANALPTGELPRNPLLEAAWAAYPFGAGSVSSDSGRSATPTTHPDVRRTEDSVAPEPGAEGSPPTIEAKSVRDGD